MNFLLPLNLWFSEGTSMKIKHLLLFYPCHIQSVILLFYSCHIQSLILLFYPCHIQSVILLFYSSHIQSAILYLLLNISINLFNVIIIFAIEMHNYTSWKLYASNFYNFMRCFFQWRNKSDLINFVPIPRILIRKWCILEAL